MYELGRSLTILIRILQENMEVQVTYKLKYAKVYSLPWILQRTGNFKMKKGMTLKTQNEEI